MMVGMAIPRLHPEHAALLVVDMQVKLLPAMHNAADLARQVGRLIDGAKLIGLPVLATEHYRKGLGPTVPELAAKLTDAAVVADKTKFSAFVEPIRATLAERGVRTVIVCGVEAHVCLLQTALDLADAGYVTAAALDAIGSRRPSDQRVAELRLVQAGVIATTVEGCLYELTRDASAPWFKAMLGVVK